MSEGVIDVFEAVQIHEQDRGSWPSRRLGTTAWVTRSVEEGPIGQAGEGIVLGSMGKLLLHDPLIAHVTENEHRPRDLPFPIVKRGGGIFDEDLPSVALDEDTVGGQGFSPVF